MRGRHVLCSRFNDSMRVMQGLLGGVSPVIEELSRMQRFRFRARCGLNDVFSMSVPA